METGPSFDRLGIMGTGRVARAMLLALAPFSRSTPLLFGRSAERARLAASHVPGAEAAARIDALAARCDTILIAVSDDAVAEVARAMAESGPFGHRILVFHVSGRSGAAVLAPLERLGALTAAIHPVMTFTGDPETEVRRMTGSPFGVTGSTPEASAAAFALVDTLRGRPFEIAEAMRPLYHGALSHAANHLVTLLAGAAQALEAAGVGTPHAVLAPLARAALENSLTQGFAALSGPLRRGDEATVKTHLAAFETHCPDILPAYRAMSLATLDRLERDGAAVAPSCRALLERD